MPFGVGIAFYKAVKRGCFGLYGEVQISSLKIRIENVLAGLDFGFAVQRGAVSHQFYDLFQQLQVQPVFVPFLPAVLVLLVDFDAIDVPVSKVYQSVG